ncbi:hypothetical protein [Caryophanon latum]|uniref:Uncharacterized protein n=1 Tax=Caryophanon latum TaxID=33977 RepID=A0A1C0YZG0_9BACL|nr:hypothetical protein [Caryophanon latum]OCS92570.1 hypothetical protein A6K76_06725 [Caryophanon latum]
MKFNELVIKFEHDTFKREKRLIDYIEKLQNEQVEVISKGMLFVLVKELNKNYVVIMNKNQIEFRFAAQYKEKKQRIQEVLHALGSLDNIRNVEALALVEIPHKEKTFNHLFQSLPKSVEVEFLGFKINDANDVYHVSLTNFIESGKRKCIIKRELSNISYDNLINYDTAIIEMKMEEMMKKTYYVINTEV